MLAWCAEGHVTFVITQVQFPLDSIYLESEARYKIVTYPPPLSPYVHVLNRHGSACAVDCPACLWSADFRWSRDHKKRSDKILTAIFRPGLVPSILTKLRALASIFVISHPPQVRQRAELKRFVFLLVLQFERTVFSLAGIEGALHLRPAFL